MGLTKQYLRYVPAGNFNIITSQECNIVFVTLEGQEGRYVAAGACEHVYIWDLRLGEKARVLLGEKSHVTCLAASPKNEHIAVGYADGTVKTFNLQTGENVSIFMGHRHGITALAYDAFGHKLASGAKDTDIIVWDVVAEVGICRLIGHKGIITQLAFMTMEFDNVIISSSADTFVKFWDLDTQHNFRTLVGHKSQVWGLSLTVNNRFLITGDNDTQLHVWKIFSVHSPNKEINTNINDVNMDEFEESDAKYPLRCRKVGTILRAGRGRIMSLTIDSTQTVVGCHGVDNTIELFKLLSEEKIKAKAAKRLLKERKKAAIEGDATSENAIESLPIRNDEFTRLPVIKASNKANSLSLIMGQGGELRVCIGVKNNSIELHSILTEEKELPVTCLRTLTTHGHRTQVRTVCFSSDNLAIATASGDSIKLWNRPSLACLRTIECGYVLTATFVPGDRHLIVGMKDGEMLIVDIASGDILEHVRAHEKELWSVTLFPDMKGVASGGGDQTVKFWNFELIQDPNTEIKAKVLSVLHSRTLKLDDCVLCVRISPNSRFVAVALLDSTVKLFFLDTFKFFISLYGHKLPVLSMDISSDSTLIATGSADRNIKIWGLDFGDCHKSLFAHDDSVTGVSFVPGTHYLFTCGKDGEIKEWDADSFNKIVTLQGHCGQAWSCAVSSNGLFVVSCGSDKVVRLYERSDEPLVLQDEEEEEREQQENELATGETTAVQGQKQQVLPSRKTVNSEKAAELILECLEVSSSYNEQLAMSNSSQEPPPLPLVMQAYNCTTTEDYLLEVIKRIRASELQETLLLLTYSAACDILEILPKLLQRDDCTELIARLALCLIEAHHGPIISNLKLLPIVENIKTLAQCKVNALRDVVGYNLHGMMCIQTVIEERQEVLLFRDATKNIKKKNKLRRNKEQALKRAIMTL